MIAEVRIFSRFITVKALQILSASKSYKCIKKSLNDGVEIALMNFELFLLLVILLMAVWAVSSINYNNIGN